ncbi:GntR family transcriptional regulator [Caulobacter soli]|uniref:GntR family transcriptional regulator n=1 Tax=Caulobacter soli TaxID=2708539 RepID=UPI0013ED160E|nr:GntR family transcriptional regulator [Caulobacter soli]
MIEREATGERVYLAIKAFLLSDGDHWPGDRIDIAGLSRRVGSSATPVRAALHRMAGERLLVSHQGEGFSLPRITEPGLSDLYAWNASVIVQAVRSAPAGPAPSSVAIDAQEPVLAIERLFAVIAAQSDNVEVEWAVAGASDRLHRARRAELALMADPAGEAAGLAELAAGDDAAALRQALVAYHRRRLRLVPALVRALHGLGDRQPR